MGLLSQIRQQQAQARAQQGAQQYNNLLSYQAARDSASQGAVGAPGGLLSDTTNPYKSYGDAAVMGALMAPGIGDVTGPVYDAQNFLRHPESRTPANFLLAGLGLLPAVPSLAYLMNRSTRGAGRMAKAIPGQSGMVGYHGSPHRFDQFDMSKIGTGEGAQAYGHGLYFAENPGTAKYYAKKLSGASDDGPGGAADWIKAYGSKDDALIAAKKQYADELAYFEGRSDIGEVHKIYKKTIDSIENYSAPNFYEVDIPDEQIDKMLDWDAPTLSAEKAHAIEAAIRKAANIQPVKMSNGRYGLTSVDASGTGRVIGEFGKTAKDTESGLARMWMGTDGASVYRDISKMLGGDEAASRVLSEAGIPGIKYFDGNSRSAGEGTRNFVVFDDKIPKILKRE